MLSTAQAETHVADLVQRARKAGADAADALYAGGASTNVQVRLGALEDVERSEGEEIGLRVFVGQRSASASTSDLSGESFDALVERVVAMAREAPEDPYAGLAPEDRLMTGDLPALDIDDGGDADPAALKLRALAAEDAARAVAGVTNSEGAGAGASRSTFALATSTGFTRGYAGTGHSLSASVLAGTGSGMQRDYGYHSVRHLSDLDAPEALGRVAGERAVAKLDPVRPASGPMPVVFDPRVGNGLLSHLIGAITGGAIARKTSFLLDRLGEEVFAPGITVVDDPLRLRGLRSRPFDGEGLPTAETVMIDKGVLTSWIMAVAAANQLGLQPTGHASRGTGGAPGASATNLHMEPGSVTPAELIADIREGIYVTELIGMGVNGVTGDYSRGAAGFLIENGEITRPVAEVTVAGNLKDMYRALIPANDLEFRYAINVPTLRVDGMTVAGG
ncbi:TldD/PmbA family protein [Sphingomonas sp. C3-2]|uniref:TldD/PmbA family protein n=1 Tax=Sphingomonas sp. C3-2 TaxID=3062169 RepID=UPI00294B9266|nr:TldD/PmbA family protein [Sphingomonas sp. C3-2]WOK35789.1 TldD/PmbA family protein [Sphingomonas sp. C3-2]